VFVSPSISGVNPSQPQATDGRQSFTIYGSNFDTSAYANLYDNGGFLHTLCLLRNPDHHDHLSRP
jgi:hypothetical protein